ncbi:UNVERIFIED_CONTAM: hypothetical protein FKN15_074617 [Acipenser sinensis]
MVSLSLLDVALEIPNCELNSKRLAVTAEEDCELLKRSSRDYARIKATIALYGLQTESLLHPSLSYFKTTTVLQALVCASSNWTVSSPQERASLADIDVETVLVKEGEVCPFAGYIRSGQSNILRDIGAFVKRPLGKLAGHLELI